MAHLTLGEMSMMKKLTLTLVYLSGISLAVAIVDTKPFDVPGFQKVQRTVKCNKGYEWQQSFRPVYLSAEK